MIQIKELNHYFASKDNKLQVLSDVNLTVNEGEFIAIQGRSGSGKSTLLNILGGFLKPSTGTIAVHGSELTGMKENELSLYRRNQVGFVFQQFHLFANMNAVNNVEEPLFYAGVKKKLRQVRAKEILEQVGLGDRINHLTHELSGGQQQRVSIARALVTNPNLILADEPTGNLDTSTEQEILSLLLKVNKELGKTLVVVTHNDHVAQVADRRLQIEDGYLKELA
ncbi:ABC transporter ATP-binding protein [Paenibacillus sp. KN14-4R]|uniref:ABC transporter ATP-binding protein n=1 Tax=Paenibacillus sp. KN14-4R TaxID=3445773 RepID=UPI003FA122DC